MKREIADKLLEKANKKTKDGVYSYEGHPYAVIKGRLRFVGDFNKIIEVFQGFFVIIGECEHWRTKTRIKQLFQENSNK